MPLIDKGKTIISRNPEITAYEIAVAEGFVGTREDWVDSVPIYKSYVAIVSQLGKNAPTATVLNNTLGGVPTWSYIGDGSYRLNLTGAFINGKTWTNYRSVMITEDIQVSINRANDNYITITTILGDLPTDGILTTLPLEIRVYP